MNLRERSRLVGDKCGDNGGRCDWKHALPPATFPLDGVISGWTEGLQLMVEGEKTRFWIPEPLAYQGRRAPFGLLVFDVELLKVQ